MNPEAHAAAVRALIAATGVRVYEGDRPESSPLPCAVLYIDNGRASRTRMTPDSDRVTSSVQVTSVGLDPLGVRSVANRVRDALLDVRPVIAGRTAWPMTQEASDPMRLDRDVTPHVFMTVDVYALNSIPA